MTPRRFCQVFFGTAALLAAAAVCSCGQRASPHAGAPRGESRPTTGSVGSTQTESPRSVYESAALDLQAMFARLAEAPSAQAAEAPGPVPVPVPTRPAVPAALEPPIAAASTAEPEQPSERERRIEYAKRLAEILNSEGAAADSPLKAVLPLIALEAIQPGVAAAELQALLPRLSPRERQTVESVRALMSQLDEQADSGADPRALAEVVRTTVDRAAPPPPPPPAPETLTLGNVALCRRVDSFGRYTPYASSTFVARQRIPMIVYTEVENYAQAREAELPPTDGRPTSLSRPGSPDRWALELSQEIHLYAADGSLQWFVKEQTHRDVSQSKRRDFFLVQRIDLPAELSVGRYTLKVIVRDKGAARLAGLPPDAEPATEVNIPIQIVADAAVAARDTTRPVVSGRPTPPATVNAPTDVRPR
ncbi:MAG: hypothetical protein KF699_06875 [Phycisphaeraceae bacterium]|nr:hypothetical protein [Phycisphaeraceae bacterium]